MTDDDDAAAVNACLDAIEAHLDREELDQEGLHHLLTDLDAFRSGYPTRDADVTAVILEDAAWDSVLMVLGDHVEQLYGPTDEDPPDAALDDIEFLEGVCDDIYGQFGSGRDE